MNANIENKLKLIPHKPGCYLWKDQHNVIVYIGKAKDLSKRVHQYFSNNASLKTKKLVEKIYDIDFITVNNENESLILENNLIKMHKPKYNVLLKDGTNYPYIVLTDEKHPRLIYTHNMNIYKGKYFGPFAPPIFNSYGIYKFLLKLFPLRKCQKIPHRKCLHYDMGHCLGPCINKINNEDYKKIENDIINFFNNDISEIINELYNKEKAYSENLQFEEAKEILDITNSIKNIWMKQNVNIISKQQIDVIGFYSYNDFITIVVLSYKNGKLLAKNQQISHINSDINEAIISYLCQFYLDNFNKPDICYIALNDINIKQLSLITNIKFINQPVGKFKTILQLAADNAKMFYKTNFLQFVKKASIFENGFDELKKILNEESLHLIHMFDMSNLFNENKVGAMIALEEGNFNKKLYRKFIIKNQFSTSDVSCTKEVIFRKYHDAIKQNERLPDLIIADGGSQQVNVINETLSKLNLNEKIKVIGLVKNKDHKTEKIYLDRNKIFNLKKDSNLYFFVSRIQDECHRFAITFFKNKKISSLLKRKIEEMPGIGKKTAEKILSRYQDINDLKKVSLQELSQFVNYKVASLIKKYIK